MRGTNGNEIVWELIKRLKIVVETEQNLSKNALKRELEMDSGFRIGTTIGYGTKNLCRNLLTSSIYCTKQRKLAQKWSLVTQLQISWLCETVWPQLARDCVFLSKWVNFLLLRL